MKKFLLFLLLFVNLHIVMTVSAQQKGVELREVVIIAPKVVCECCHDSINSLYEYITVHQPICPMWLEPCPYCIEKTLVPRCQLEDHCRKYHSPNKDSGVKSAGESDDGSNGNDSEGDSDGETEGYSGSSSGGGGGGFGGLGGATNLPHWGYNQPQSFLGRMFSNSDPFGVGTYTPRYGDVLISNINIPAFFPIKLGTKDCGTACLGYMFSMSTPNSTYGTFSKIVDYFATYLWDNFEQHDVYNDRGINQIEKNQLFPKFGLHKVSPDGIMNSLESGNPVYGALRTGYYDVNHNWYYYDKTHDNSYPRIDGHAVVIVGYNPIYHDFICMDPDLGRITYYPMADFQCGYAIPTNQSTHWEFNLNNQYNPYFNVFMIEK